MDQQIEIEKQFRQQQEKLVYYIIGLSVAAIGFSVHKTSGQFLKLSQIPLGLSVLCWGLSIFLGFKFMKCVISSLFSNHVYLTVIRGLHPEIGNHPQKIDIASSGIIQALKNNSSISSSLLKWQEILFYMGILLFIVWHVLEMYMITPYRSHVLLGF
jgi:hypothetical protein